MAGSFPSPSFRRTFLLLAFSISILWLSGCAAASPTPNPTPDPSSTEPTLGPSPAYPAPGTENSPAPGGSPPSLLSPLSARTLPPLFSLVTSTASPTASGTPTRTPTVTKTPTRTVTATPGPTTTLTSRPTRTPSQTPAGTLTPTPLRVETGLFRIVFSLKNMPPGLVTAIHPLSGQHVLITGTYGVVSLDLFSEAVRELRTPDRLLGIDSSGRAWLTPANGASISSWDTRDKKSYVFGDGWILNAAFFNAPIGGSRLVDGRPGEVWLATSADVRHFDGDRWRIFTATESGIRFTRQAYVRTSIALAVNPNTGEAIAGTCDWRGENRLDGGPIRRYDGLSWIDAGFPLENPCVNWLKAAPDGTIFAAVDGSLWQIKGDGPWIELKLPRLSSFQQYWIVEDLPLDHAGNPWPLVQVADLDGNIIERIRFQWDGSEWRPMRFLNQIEQQDLLFLPGGKVWSLEQSAIYALQASGDWQLQASMDYRTGASDPEGGIWLVTDVETNPLLWRGLP